MVETYANKDLKQYWRVRDVFYVLLLYFAILIFFLFIETKIFGKGVLDDSSLSPSLLIFEDIVDAIIFTVLPIFFVSKLYKAGLKDIGLTLQGFKRNLLIGALIGILLWGIISVCDASIKSMWGETPKHPYIQKLERSSNPVNYIAVLISISILGPISEEVYFRGFAYTIFKKQQGKIIGLILSSLLFAGIHFNLWWLVQIFIAGVGLAILFERTHSLISAITAHAVINVFSVYIGNL